ncbi:hypothetical protein CLU79DRAFT_694931, partial [Phycomyces nitens]
QSKNMRINVAVLFRNALHGVTDIMYFEVFEVLIFLFSLLYYVYMKWLPQHEIYLGSLGNDVISVPTNQLFLEDLPDLTTTLFVRKFGVVNL